MILYQKLLNIDLGGGRGTFIEELVSNFELFKDELKYNKN
jgi:hypothetical protein